MSVEPRRIWTPIGSTRHQSSTFGQLERPLGVVIVKAIPAVVIIVFDVARYRYPYRHHLSIPLSLSLLFSISCRSNPFRYLFRYQYIHRKTYRYRFRYQYCYSFCHRYRYHCHYRQGQGTTEADNQPSEQRKTRHKSRRHVRCLKSVLPSNVPSVRTLGFRF